MSVTLAIILITSVISLWAWQNPTLMDRWLLNPVRITKNGQYYRLLTSGFLHADFGHLLFNMLSLYFFGSVIEQVFSVLFGESGPIYLLIFYLVAIVVSDIPTLLRHRKNSNYNSLGASGGVSALIFAAILFAPLNKICLYFAICIPGFIFGLLYLGFSYYSARRGLGNINHDAHFYGAVFGMLCMVVLYPPVLPNFFAQIADWRMF